jgi:DNA repair and recombination protein RAD52
MFSPEQEGQLNAPLDPRHVKPPPQGKYGEYVDSHHVLSEANRIFGFDGWGYVITSLVQCSRVEAKDSRGQPQVRVGYRCTVRATAGGVDREGAAVGSGMAKPENEADAHESAVKEAETDALKRALRSFGNTFGLALYDKTKANVAEARITEDQVNQLILELQARNIVPGDLISIANQNLGTSINNLTQLPAASFADALSWVQSQKKAA